MGACNIPAVTLELEFVFRTKRNQRAGRKAVRLSPAARQDSAWGTLRNEGG